MSLRFTLDISFWELIYSDLVDESKVYWEETLQLGDFVPLSYVDYFRVGVADCHSRACSSCGLSSCRKGAFLFLLKAKYTDPTQKTTDQDYRSSSPNYYYKLRAQLKGKGKQRNSKVSFFDILARFLNFENFEAYLAAKGIPFPGHADANLPPAEKDNNFHKTTLQKRYSFLLDTKWAFYHYNYYEKDAYQITRLLMEISDLQNYPDIITIQTLDDQDTFTGCIDCVNSTAEFVIANLHNSLHKKYLQLRFFIPTGGVKHPLFLGQFMDIDNGLRLVSGTFVMQEISPSLEPLTIIRNFTIPSLDAQNEVSPFIVGYLANKWQNFSKTPSGIFSLPMLKQFLDKHIVQQTLKQQSSFKQYDAFISAPIHSVKNKRFLAIKANINNLIDSFDDEMANKGISKDNVFYAPRNLQIDSNNTSPDPIKLLDYELKVIKTSRIFILYLPEDKNLDSPSSAFVAAGYALALEIPIFILCGDPTKIPYLLRDRSDTVRIFKPNRKLTNNLAILKWLKQHLPV